MKIFPLCSFIFGSLLFNRVQALPTDEELWGQLVSLETDVNSALSEYRAHYDKMVKVLFSYTAEALSLDGFHPTREDRLDVIKASEKLTKAKIFSRLNIENYFEQLEMERLQGLVEFEEKANDVKYDVITGDLFRKNKDIIRIDELHREEELKKFHEFGNKHKSLEREIEAEMRPPKFTFALYKVAKLVHLFHDYINQGMMPLEMGKRINDHNSLD